MNVPSCSDEHARGGKSLPPDSGPMPCEVHPGRTARSPATNEGMASSLERLAITQFQRYTCMGPEPDHGIRIHEWGTVSQGGVTGSPFGCNPDARFDRFGGVGRIRSQGWFLTGTPAVTGRRACPLRLAHGCGPRSSTTLSCDTPGECGGCVAPGLWCNRRSLVARDRRHALHPAAHPASHRTRYRES